MEVVEIEKEKLEPLPGNFRKMTDEDIMLLERSLKDLGVVEPLHVVEYDGGSRYVIVNGNHRFKVLIEKFGLEKIPCVIIGRDWPIERLYAEAVRLNSISGEFDTVSFLEKVGNMVKKWANEGMTSKDVLPSLGLKSRNRLVKMLARRLDVGDFWGEDFEFEKKQKVVKPSQLEKILEREIVHPITFFGNICVIKDDECVDMIREIVLSAEVDEGVSGIRVLKEILRSALGEENE